MQPYLSIISYITYFCQLYATLVVMKVLFALGNPEQKYTGTRHNAGFWALEQLAQRYGAVFKDTPKFRARIASVTTGGEKVLLVQPATYYNEVGVCARALIDFYKLTAEDFLIIHDDLALPLGTIRTRLGGSHGGSNGLKSLAAHIGTGTARLRIGVWAEQHHGADRTNVVLGKLTSQEQMVLGEQVDTIAAIAASFLSGDFAATTHRS